MRILVPFGTRPEIVKLAPVVAELSRRGFSLHTVATGQHDVPGMSDDFFNDLGLAPDERWRLPRDESERVGAMLANAYRVLGTERPDLVLLLGDTHTVPLFCLAARRHQIPLAHLEAGLRSFNQTSLEEVNRRVAAATASLHLAPTHSAARHLGAEGVPAHRVRVVGNPVLDVLRAIDVKAKPPGKRRQVVVTAHRATNVDDPERLESLVRIVVRLAREVGPVVYPVHPRTMARLEAAGLLGSLQRSNIELQEPAPYPKMLDLLAAARVIVTDSGGLQEEAAWLGIPVVVLRSSTPRWEGVEAGTSVLAGLDADRAVSAAARLAQPVEQARVAASPCPYGDGHTAERVADILEDPATLPLLRLAEPSLDGGAAAGGAVGAGEAVGAGVAGRAGIAS